MAPVTYNIEEWISENQKFFQPPICNKLMYESGQLKCFFVGGPNQRKDFHMEEGEELFYMLKGDMNLIVVEKGKFKNIIIKEGEVFLLPGRIPHSPQRFENTVGLVIERERSATEIDGLRYYIDGTSEILYERWFHCDSLDTQLPPIIRGYFNSEEFRTNKPIPEHIMENKPLKQDFELELDQPFCLIEWIRTNKTSNKLRLFNSSYSSRIFVLKEGDHFPEKDRPETFLWQMEGHSMIDLGDGNLHDLKKGHVSLMKKGESWRLKNNDEGITLFVVMNPEYE